jgi:hypothetical protein
VAAQDGSGRRAIVVLTLVAFAPVKRAIPGVRLGPAGEAETRDQSSSPWPWWGRSAWGAWPLTPSPGGCRADSQRCPSKWGATDERGSANHTGWGKLWAKDNARYVKTCPGIGVAAAEWLAKQDPMLVGADNWPVEVGPNPDPQVSLPVHQILLVVNGIHLLENLKLDELVGKRVYEFAFMMQPLKIQGGSGSTVAHVAVR